MLKRNFKLFIITFLYLVLVIFVLSKLLFTDSLIGRYIDCSVPPVSFLMKNVLKINFFTWNDHANAGVRSTFSATLIPVNSLLYLPLILKSSVWLVSRFQLVFPLFIAFFSFYMLARQLLRDKRLNNLSLNIIVVLGSIFFTLNSYFFCELIFGSSPMYLTFALTPLLLYLFLGHLTTKRHSFFVGTVLTLLVVSSTIQHLVLALIFLSVFSFAYRRFRPLMRVIIWYILLSLFWILPFLNTSSQLKMQELAQDYSNGLTESSTNFISSLINKDYFGNRNIYTVSLGNEYLTWFWVLNAFLLLIVALYVIGQQKNKKQSEHRLVLAMLVIFAGSLLFIKGGKSPLGSFVLYLYQHFSPMNVFRSLQHYISFYVLSISVLFVFSTYYLIKRNRRLYWVIGLMVLINALPWVLSRDLGRTNLIANANIPSYVGEYKLSKGEYVFYNLNQKISDFSIMTLPPGFSVYFLPSENNSAKTQGGDSGLSYGNKQFYATDVTSSLSPFLDQLERNLYLQDDFFNRNKNLFSMLEIKYFIVRDNIEPSTSTYFKIFSLDKLKESINLSQIFKDVKEFKEIKILETKNYWSRLYIPNEVIHSSDKTSNLSEILQQIKTTGLVIFEESQTNFQALVDNLPQGERADNPVVEYKKVNSTKYQIIIHHVKNDFPLVFSQTFNTGWKLFASDTQVSDKKILTGLLRNYKILSGEDDQATKTEVEEYINAGVISTLGDLQAKERILENDHGETTEKESYKIGFVSRNNYGTIQNENLSDGLIWENWAKKEIDANHFIANGYANGWLVNPDSICQRHYCLENSDGSVDLTLTLEFAPQKSFYIGLGISGITLLLLVVTLFIGILKGFRTKHEAD